MPDRRTVAFALFAALSVGCGAPSEDATPDDAPTTASDAVTGERGTDASTWTMSAMRFGPLTIGVHAADASPLVRGTLMITNERDPQGCEYAEWSEAPDQVRLMFVGGRLARVESESRAVGTVEGARVGDTEARIDSIHGARVIRQPHKYTTGRYLIVRVPADAPTHAYVFETDGARVTRLRAGRLPEVEWVEGCA